MDQSSSNDTDKRNWRERLGIGNRELPRISGEFSRAKDATLVEVKPEERSAQPVAVAKPAPMAPRVPPKTEGAAPQAERQMSAQNSRPMQPSLPQSQDALADKLRSQRAAAEKLAEQRVSSARERSENPAIAPAKPAAPPAGEKPKFTFAEDEAKPDYIRNLQGAVPARPQQRPVQQTQLSPPRPALGGERILGVPQRQPGPPPAGYQPQFRPQPSQGYRPIEGLNGSRQPSMPPMQRRPAPGPMGQAVASEPRLQPPRQNPPAYARPAQDDFGYTRTAYEPPPRPALRQEPARIKPPVFEDDFGDEIFEDAPLPKNNRRASATDYNQAYRESEDAYGNERRRSLAPLIILSLLVVLTLAGAATVWYVNSNSTTEAAAVPTESAPVVAAPEQAAKVAPEIPVKAGLPAESAADSSKKEIYDRIIGDREVPGGKIVPTEEIPVQLDKSQVPEPTGQTIQPSSDETITDEALPLSMPPPPGATNDTQGAMPAPTSKQSVALAAPPVVDEPPPPETAADEEIPVVEIPETTTTDVAANSEQAAPPASAAPAAEEIAIVDPAPIQKKTTAKTAEKPKAKTEQVAALGAEPVVLVPPSESFAPAENASAPVAQEQPVAAQPAPVVKKKKTLLDLFNGAKDDTAAPAPSAPKQEVAAVAEAAPQPAPQKSTEPVQVASAAAGFYVQLASFRSEAEAKTEYARIKAKYGAVIGNLPPVINSAPVNGSTRYRLAFGPLPSHEKAEGVCKSLRAAGVPDCLVPRQ
jgi:SPOR domain